MDFLTNRPLHIFRFHASISKTDRLDYLNSYHVCGLVSLTYIHEKSSGQRTHTPTERLDIKWQFWHTLNRPPKTRPQASRFRILSF